jgi:hypothetical protein
MSETPEQDHDQDDHDQDAEPTMTAPGEERPDGTEASRPDDGGSTGS